MRIVILVSAFPPRHIGGTEIATCNIAKYLARLGHDIHVITLEEEDSTGIKQAHNFHIHRILLSRIKFLGSIASWFEIIRKIQMLNPDIISVQSIPMAIPAYFLNFLTGKDYIVWCRGSDIYQPWPLKEFISRRVLKNAIASIALTADMKNLMSRYIDENSINVIPNGVDFDEFSKLSNDKNKKIDKDHKVILYVGSLRLSKGVNYLIESLKLIMNEVPMVELVIIGDGDQRKRLENLTGSLELTKYIKFMGILSHKDVIDCMLDSDIFILPSLSEGFPNVIIEAMATGLPIIATNIGGIPEVVKHMKNGLLVEPKSSVEIAAKAISLLTNEDLRKKISDNNKLEAQKFSVKDIVLDLNEIYIQIAKDIRP